MESSLESRTTGYEADMGMNFFLITTILSLGGMWMDVFIVAVNCRDWMKKKCLSLTDRILTLQGSLRISHECLGMLWCALSKFCPWITQTGSVVKMFKFSLWYFNTYNLWLTALLCSYYCVKIADFRHPFFICLKLRLSRLVLPWLLGSMILSLASSLPYAYIDLVLGCRKKNVTAANEKRVMLHVHTLQGLGYFAAFTICVTSAFLLLFSLWRHRQRMLGSWNGHRSPQSYAHFQALLIILFRLFNHVVFFVSIFLLFLSDHEGNCIVNVAALAVLYTCFLVDSLISLWGQKKLKNELCRAWYFAECRSCAT